MDKFKSGDVVSTKFHFGIGQIIATRRYSGDTRVFYHIRWLDNDLVSIHEEGELRIPDFIADFKERIKERLF